MGPSDRTSVPPFPDEGHAPDQRRLTRSIQVDHLAAVPLFSSCSKRDLRHLASSTRLELAEADDALVSEGQPSREAFVIIAGHAIVRRKGRRVAVLGPGDFVGELGLLLRRPHEATVVATTPVEMLVLTQTSLREAVDQVPGLGWKLLQTVAARMDSNALG